MKFRNMISWAALAALSLSAARLEAATVVVNNFGVQGWNSDDTRDSAGTNLVGVNNTHAGKPGEVPTLAADAAIAAQIQFLPGPAGSTYGGAVSMDGTASSSGKSNFSVINSTTGFDDASNLLTTFSATYEMYKQHTGAGSTLAFKLGIQSTEWGTGAGESQNGFTAQRSGESEWDLVLVHVPTVVNNTWTTINLDPLNGNWTLFKQASNGFFTIAPAYANPFAQTLDAWGDDATWGPVLFGAGAKVTSIQFGLGSGQAIAKGLVDYLQTNLLNGGDVVDFQAVPEPSSCVLAAFGLVGLVGYGLRRRRLVR